jgi:DNA-binding transcriptional LysR family regulator
MRRRLPPLENIEAFIVAASSPSFRAAADALALSPAALTRRIQSLSDHMGVKLFARHANGVRLTDAGTRCLEEIEPAYLELLRATTAMERTKERSHDVKLSLSHSLAVGWLIPRLGKFRAAHPDIELSFKTQRTASFLRRGDVDLAICYSDIDVTGFESEPLLSVSCTPVASPRLAKAYREDGGPLDRHPLLAAVSPVGNIWPWWSRLTGVEIENDTCLEFDTLHAMYEAASQDIGIAMATSVTVRPHLESGRLELLGLPVTRGSSGGNYHLVAKAPRKRERAVATAWRWLKAEAARTSSPFELPAAAA